jgi:lipoprotein signal peptidase
MLNQGISFGLFQGVSVWVVGIIWIGLLVYAVKMRELWGRVGMGLILLGGAGNIISRVVYGGVVDNWNFLGILHNNGWDYLIFAGVIVYVWQNVFLSHD